MAKITPVTSGYFWWAQEKELQSYQDYLESVSKEVAWDVDLDAAQQKKLTQLKNTGTAADYEQYLADLWNFKKEYQWRIEKQRSKAQDILKEQEAWVGLEAQIQAAKAWASWDLAQSQLAKISKWISESYGLALSEARNNLNTFEQWLDKNLNDLNISTLEQEQMLTTLKKVLSDEEAAPAIAAIAKNATSRKEYADMFNAYYSWLLKVQAGKLTAKGEEEQRYVYDEGYWNSLDAEGKQKYLTRTMWGVLDQDTVQQIISSWMNSEDAAKVFSTVNRLKKLNEVQKQAFLTSIWEPWTAAKFYTEAIKYFNSNNITDSIEDKTTDTTYTPPVDETINDETTDVTETTPEFWSWDFLPADITGNDITAKPDVEKYTFPTIIPVNAQDYKSFMQDMSVNYIKTTDPTKLAKLAEVNDKFTELYTPIYKTDPERYFKTSYALIKKLIELNYLTSK